MSCSLVIKKFNEKTGLPPKVQILLFWNKLIIMCTKFLIPKLLKSHEREKSFIHLVVLQRCGTHFEPIQSRGVTNKHGETYGVVIFSRSIINIEQTVVHMVAMLL